jgi:NAD(P)-dependent dehydrogenase (short-subunit alcohol dehydrogenase family)
MSIGYQTAFQMAARGATVYIGARSAAKAKEGVLQMKKDDPRIRDEQLRTFVADLGDLKAVQRAAEELIKETDRLDILINNAGV